MATKGHAECLKLGINVSKSRGGACCQGAGVHGEMLDAAHNTKGMNT